MNHRTGGEEEQRFEEGVGHQVEDGRRISRDSARHEHVAELRDGGVGQDTLDISLHHTDGRGENCGERADDRDRHQSGGSVVEDGVGARDHVNAGRDHGGRVNQR